MNTKTTTMSSAQKDALDMIDRLTLSCANHPHTEPEVWDELALESISNNLRVFLFYDQF